MTIRKKLSEQLKILNSIHSNMNSMTNKDNGLVLLPSKRSSTQQGRIYGGGSGDRSAPMAL